MSSGHLEITETDLILYLKGKQPVRWPLKYLKRYGFEVNNPPPSPSSNPSEGCTLQDGLFSFEAGRKTVSPGVYAFKCRRAEKLFNLLQVRVREQGQLGPQGGPLSTSLSPPPLLTPDHEEPPGSPQGSVTVSQSPPGPRGSVVITD